MAAVTGSEVISGGRLSVAILATKPSRQVAPRWDCSAFTSGKSVFERVKPVT